MKFDLLCLLQVISNFAYDIHYTAKGKFFYSDHIFSERLGDRDEFADIQDDLIETLWLGRGEDAPKSADISAKVAEMTPEVLPETDKNFKALRELIIAALVMIEQMTGLRVGEQDLIGTIAHILQRHNGLLYRQLVYTPEEVKNSNEAWDNIVKPDDTMGTKENGEKEDKIAYVMKEFEDGNLKTPDGNVVTDKDQALAIAYSEAEKKED